jgi:uncharacterized YccA/Bax inhibitor family protein
VRTSSNPVFRNLPQQPGGYATFGGSAAGASQAAYQGGQYGQYGQQTPYGAPQQWERPAPVQRAMTVDDVVTKTGITLGTLSLTAIVSYFLVSANPALAAPFVIGGAIVGLVLVLIATFGRKMDRPGLVLGYAVAEGIFLGAISLMFTIGGGPALILQAVVGTLGVFGGMLFVYKTGAIRVTPKFTRMIVAAMFGVLALMVVNLLAALIGGGDGLGLRGNGPLAIGFSLVCIAIAAFSFLLDFDAADQMIRAGAPERAAWAVALGLTITLVWLYIEILRLLSILNQD